MEKTIFTLKDLNEEQFLSILGKPRHGLYINNADKKSKNPVFKPIEKMRESSITYDRPTHKHTSWLNSKTGLKAAISGFVESEAKSEVCKGFGETMLKCGISYESSEEEKTDYEYCYSEALYCKGEYDFTYHFTRENMYDDCKYFFDDRPITLENVKKFHELYGEIIPTKVIVGGKRFVEKQINKKGLTKERKFKIESEAQAKLIIQGSKPGGSNKAELKYENIRNETSEFGFSDIITLGGDGTHAENPDEWLKSLYNYSNYRI